MENMEKQYFIIRIGGWCCGFHYGTMQELESVLGTLGARITGTVDADFERIGFVFDKMLTTTMKVFGKNKKTYDGIMDGIVEVFKKHGVEIERVDIEYIPLLQLRATVKNVFDTDKLDVLVSDGVFHPKPGIGYIGVYDTYKPFSEFREDWIWQNLGQFCGYSKPSDATTSASTV